MDHKLDFLGDVLKAAEQAGADNADAIITHSSSTNVTCSGGKLENTGRAETTSLSLRMFMGQRTATFSSSNFEFESINALIEQTLTIAKHAPEDPQAGLLSKDQFTAQTDMDLKFCDKETVPVETLLEAALATEAAARAVEGVQDGTEASTMMGDFARAIRTSQGFAGVEKRTMFSRSCGALATNGIDKEMGHDFSATPFLKDLKGAAAIGRQAGERAVRKLGGRKMKTGQFPVVFASEVSDRFVEFFAELIAGSQIVSGMSFIKDRLGKQVFAEGIQIIDDPHRLGGHASRAFDGEGAPTRRIAFIENGVLTEWMHNQASARQLGAPLTGHGKGLGGGIGASNMFMEAGQSTVDDLLSDIEYGFYVTDMLGHGPNAVTGNYSQGAAGLLIENGKMTSAVKEVTIAGNLADMYMNMTPANDLEFTGPINAPTLRVDGMMVAGA